LLGPFLANEGIAKFLFGITALHVRERDLVLSLGMREDCVVRDLIFKELFQLKSSRVEKTHDGDRYVELYSHDAGWFRGVKFRGSNIWRSTGSLIYYGASHTAIQGAVL